MRHGMIQGRRYPAFAGHIVEYLAQSLFFTSDLALPAGEKKALTAIFSGNTELCKITEDLVFTDPYRIAKRTAGRRRSSTASPPSSGPMSPSSSPSRGSSTNS